MFQQQSNTKSKLAPRRRQWIPILTVVSVAVLSSRPTAAITINVTYSDDVVTPYDPDGSRLLDIANAAASFWEDYLHDSFSISIDFCYENLPTDASGQVLGEANSVTDDISIQASPTSPWFFDPSPLEHNEFDFSGTGTPDNGYAGQTLYRDVGTSNQDAWFNGSVPGLFEIGYRGVATDPAAVGRYDLFSTVIHEIGHILGVNFDPFDESWDPPASQVAGQSIEIEPDPDDSGHLAARSALMCKGCGELNARRLPSVVDILAVAADESWNAIDLPRQDYVGNGNWNQTNRWIGGAPPDFQDDAYLRGGANVSLSSNAVAGNLLMSENAQLNVLNHTLEVNNTVQLNAQLLSLPHARVTVPSGGVLSAGRLELNGGQLQLAGGLADIGNDVQVNSRGRIQGFGKLLAIALVSEGLIRADGGTLEIESLGANLDGDSGQGMLQAVDGNLKITGIVPSFTGTATIGPGHWLEMVPWTITSNGDLNLNAAGLSAPILRGGELTNQGNVTVSGGLALIDAPVRFGQISNVMVETGSTLWLNGPTTFGGGSYLGDTMAQNGDAVVNTFTRIDLHTYDMDGLPSSPSTITINENRTFRLDVQSIENQSGDGYDGTLNINGGTLDVRTHILLGGPGGQTISFPTPWTMEGVINLNQTGSAFPTVAGSRMIVGQVPDGGLDELGALNVVSGEAFLTAPVTLQGTSFVSIPTGSVLHLASSDPTFYRGGNFSGGGVLSQSSDAIVQDNTTISGVVYDMDGQAEGSTLTIDPGATLTVAANRIEEAGVNDFDGTVVLHGGTLNMQTFRTLVGPGGEIIQTDRPWRMEGNLELHHDDAPATVAGVKMFVGQPDAAQPPAHVTVAAGEALFDTSVEVEPRAEFEFLLGGTASGEFGQLHVLDTLLLDGDLLVTLEDAFIPGLGDLFPIIQADAGLSGAFSSLVLPTLSNGLKWEMDYGASSLLLEVVAGFSADFDNDGDVDGDDLVKWKADYGGPGSDGDGDGDSDGADYLIWQREFGLNAPLAQASSPGVVPEPSALASVVALIFAALCVRNCSVLSMTRTSAVR